MTSVSELQNHCNRTLQLLKDRSVIARPVSAKLLRAYEKATSQNKGTICYTRSRIALQNTKIGRFLMERTVCIVNLEVSPLSAINFYVNSVHRHRMRVSTKDSWLIHVVPKRVNVG